MPSELTMRKAVAIAFGVCGAGAVVCEHRLEWLRAVRWNTGVWPIASAGFAIGMYFCLIVTSSLVAESVIRRWKGRPLKTFEFICAGMLGTAVFAVAVGSLIAMTWMFPSQKGGNRDRRVGAAVYYYCRSESLDRHGQRGEEHQRQPGGERRLQPAGEAQRLAAQLHDHEQRHHADAQADREVRIAIAARHHQRQAEEQQRRIEKRLQEARMDRVADVGAQVGARAAQLVDQLARRSVVAPRRAGREKLERHAAHDEHLVRLEPLGVVAA